MNLEINKGNHKLAITNYNEDETQFTKGPFLFLRKDYEKDN